MSYKVKKPFSICGKKQTIGDILNDVPERLLNPLIKKGFVVKEETVLKKSKKVEEKVEENEMEEK